MKTSKILATVLCCAFLATGCGSDSDTDSAVSGNSSAASGSTSQSAAESDAANNAAQNIEGKDEELATANAFVAAVFGGNANSYVSLVNPTLLEHTLTQDGFNVAGYTAAMQEQLDVVAQTISSAIGVASTDLLNNVTFTAQSVKESDDINYTAFATGLSGAKNMYRAAGVNVSDFAAVVMTRQIGQGDVYPNAEVEVILVKINDTWYVDFFNAHALTIGLF